MTEFWRSGFWPIPFTSIPDRARQFEDEGWDGWAVGEAQGLGPDPYVLLTMAAGATTHLGLGTGVCVPIRHPMLAASSMKMVHNISGGRGTGFTIGRGDGAMWMLGRRPIKVAEFEIYVEQVQRYLRGEVVDLDGFPSELAAPVGAYDGAVGKVPVDVTATGPRMIDLAARLADSVTFSVGASPERLFACMRQARDARRKAGLDTMPLNCYLLVSVTDNDDTSDSRDRIRGAVATHTQFSAYHGTALEGMSEHDAEVAKKLGATLREQAKTGHPDRGAQGLLEDEYIDRFAIIGPAEYCIERLEPIVELGLNRIVVITHGKPDPAEESGTRFGREVLPHLKRG